MAHELAVWAWATHLICVNLSYMPFDYINCGHDMSTILAWAPVFRLSPQHTYGLISSGDYLQIIPPAWAQ